MEILRSPCATLRAGPFGETPKLQDQVGDGIWLISSVALIVIGTLPFFSPFPLSQITGGVLASIGSFGLISFVAVSIITCFLRGVIKIIGSLAKHILTFFGSIIVRAIAGCFEGLISSPE